MTTTRPSHSTVEAILSKLDTISTADGQSFDLWFPQHLTMDGRAVRADVAMALILDKILGMGYEPDGFAEAEGGRVYKYKLMI